MAMVINTNIASLAAQRHLANSRLDMETSMERLASGKRINSAMDDAAGLSIVHSMDAQYAGLNQAVRNANDGIAMIGVAEGALEAVSSILVRMKELAVQAENGTYGTADQANLDAEYLALATEIGAIYTGTTFNGTSVLAAGTADFAVDDAGTTITATWTTASDASAATLAGDASGGRALVDSAITENDTQRAALGAVANRLQFTVQNLMNRAESVADARSRIIDADYAIESANLAKNQVLQQAGTAMLAQANASTQNVLSLLK